MDINILFNKMIELRVQNFSTLFVVRIFFFFFFFFFALHGFNFYIWVKYVVTCYLIKHHGPYMNSCIL